jgi:hypothetical protein
MSFFFATVSQLTNKLGVVTANIFSKKPEDDFVVVPRNKYNLNLDDLSKKLAEQQQELRSMPDIGTKVSQPPTSSTALQRINADLQDIAELHKINVELTKQRQALLK